MSIFPDEQRAHAISKTTSRRALSAFAHEKREVT